MTNKMKYLTVSQAEQSNESNVWVLNTSGGGGAAKGIVNLTIVEGNGRASVLRVPVTFIPIDLTTQATKNAVLSNPDFRRLIAAKVISIISDEEAQAMLSSDKAKEENRRLLNIEHAHDVQDSHLTPEVRSIKDEAAGNVGGLAMNIAHTSDGDEDAIVANLRNNAENLSQEELRYIVNNSQFHKVKALAAECIVR